MLSVALLTESVDRNVGYCLKTSAAVKSLSSRRAWIEMISTPRAWARAVVALLTESVDRNRAQSCILRYAAVALLTESVDRNRPGMAAILAFRCRSPHGERG